MFFFLRNAASASTIFVRGLVLAAVLAALAPAPASAAGGGTAASSIKGRNNRGLNVTADSRGADSTGYRPVRVQITPWPATPATAERSIRIVVSPNRYDSYSAYDYEVSKVFELQVGSTGVEGTLLVPQDRVFDHLRVDVWEDGERYEDLAMSIVGPRNWWNFNDGSKAFLWIDADAPTRRQRETMIQKKKGGTWSEKDSHNLPDIRAFHMMYPDPSQGVTQTLPNDKGVIPPIADIDTLVLANDHNRFEILPPSELPEDWLELSCYDIAFVSRGDLSTLAEKHPQKYRALRDWLGTGCQLIVSDGGDDFGHLAEIEKVLQMSPSPPPQVGGTAEPHGWRTMSEKELEKLLNNSRNGAYGTRIRRSATQTPGYESLGADYTTDEAINELKIRTQPPFAVRPIGLGVVVVLRAENPFPGNELFWQSIFETIGEGRTTWTGRHGVSLTGHNPGYWSFLIPGVGMAPVLAFLVLITLFMVLIGPVNYWFLRRVQRTYLLLLTVPCGALVMTVGLMLYALVTDGLGVSSRIRSYTHLDDSGRAFSWSRQSYYASLAPSRGLVFPANAAVYPVVPDAYRHHYTNRQRKLEWDGEEQRMQAGFIQPRTVTQFIVVRACPTEARLERLPLQSPDDPPRVINRLGAKIDLLLLRNENGTLFRGVEIDPDQTATLEPTQGLAAKRECDNLFQANEPKIAQGYDPGQNRNLFTFLIPGMMMGQFYETSSLDSCVLERTLSVAKTADLPRKSYLAIVARPAAVPVAVPYAVEKAGFHVVGGSW